MSHLKMITYNDESGFSPKLESIIFIVIFFAQIKANSGRCILLTS